MLEEKLSRKASSSVCCVPWGVSKAKTLKMNACLQFKKSQCTVWFEGLCAGKE